MEDRIWAFAISNNQRAGKQEREREREKGGGGQADRQTDRQI